MKSRKVKYKITNDFGMKSIGEIIDCYLIEDEYNIGLVLHPSNKRLGECASLEIVKRDNNQYWISMNEHSYINISAKLERKLKELFKD